MSSDTKPALPDKKSPRTRKLLLLGGPVLVAIVALAFWVFGGRYVSTEDAFIKAHLVQVAPQVSGPVQQVLVQENQPVTKGEVLLVIDPRSYRLALDRAQAQLRKTRSDIETLEATYREKKAQLALAGENVRYAQREYQRQVKLSHKHLTSQSQLDAASHALTTARQQKQALVYDLASLQASLDGSPDIPVQNHPDYKAALAQVQQAKLDLSHTEVRAPFAGIAANVPDEGAFAAQGTPLMSVVANRQPWIEANFKETDLTWLRPGQPVSISVDSYPGKTWHGRVQSIAQATGAEFSVLPPQNATGNWVKVVQRIPVRIAIAPDDQGQVLRAGMSVGVSVDTGYHNKGGLAGPLVSWLRHFFTGTDTRIPPQVSRR